jgi:hypothetical protein
MNNYFEPSKQFLFSQKRMYIWLKILVYFNKKIHMKVFFCKMFVGFNINYGYISNSF